MCMCAWTPYMCVTCMKYLQKPEEGAGNPKIEVTNCCEPGLSAGIPTLVLYKC